MIGFESFRTAYKLEAAGVIGEGYDPIHVVKIENSGEITGEDEEKKKE